MKKKLVTFLAALALMPLALPAQAHGPDYPWAGGEPIPVYLYQPDSISTSTYSPLNKGAATAAAINSALYAWNAQPSRYTFYYAGTTTSTVLTNRVLLRYDPAIGNAGVAVTDRVWCDGYVGVYMCHSQIRFNDFYYDPVGARYVYWSVNGTKNTSNPNWVDFQYALTHELGHILAQMHYTGLCTAATKTTNPTMCAQSTGFINNYYGRSLQSHDVDWINTVR